MKLPNWLHRKPAELDLGAWLDAHPGTFVEPDPYLDSLAEKTRAFDSAALDNSIALAHTRGYWEGRAEADKLVRPNPEYSVEVIHSADYDGAYVEEVLLHDADRCLVHLERIDTDHWWLTLSPSGGWDEEESFDIFRVKKCIEVTEQ